MEFPIVEMSPAFLLFSADIYTRERQTFIVRIEYDFSCFDSMDTLEIA